MAWRYDFDYYRYAPSVPRKVKGGIKSRTQRGAFGTSWWARRWIEVLESFDIGARLQRGRRYARSGQVLSIDIRKGLVQAKVQGSRPRPYSIEINVKQLSRRAWHAVADVVGSQALLEAGLMRGEMPENIEEAFRKARISLFPERHGDLDTSCSCPDWSNPCKHIAAAYYLLGEEFDRDPFLIFKLRGIERDEFVGLLEGRAAHEGHAKKPGVKPKGTRSTGRRAARSYPDENDSTVPAVAEPAFGEEVPAPLPPDPAKFWRTEAPGVLEGMKTDIPPLAAALPKQLGNLPFWRGEQELLDFLLPVYQEASAAALRVLER